VIRFELLEVNNVAASAKRTVTVGLEVVLFFSEIQQFIIGTPNPFITAIPAHQYAVGVVDITFAIFAPVSRLLCFSSDRANGINVPINQNNVFVVTLETNISLIPFSVPVVQFLSAIQTDRHI